MNDSIEFYFDFISPYSFLAHKRIRKIENEKKIKFIYKPILLGGLHNLAKITPPALIDSKKGFLIDDCNMVAKKFGIKFKFNEKFPINSLLFMRGLLIINKNLINEYIDLFFDAYWSSNYDLRSETVINKLLEKLEVNKENFYEQIKKQQTKDLLKKITQQAFDKKIFGAPTFVVNNKLFWGQDRLDYALDEFND